MTGQSSSDGSVGSPVCGLNDAGYRNPVTDRGMSFSDRLARWRRNRRIRRKAGIRTLTRPLGGSGLPAEAEAWVTQIEDELRMSEAQVRDGAAELERNPGRLAPAAVPSSASTQGTVERG
jgi:hypothetical protein